MENYMTKNELLEFIKYLKEKCEIVIDSYITRTMLRPNANRTSEVFDMVNKIKKAPSLENAYFAVASCLKREVVCEKTILPHIQFYEDLYEHIASPGLNKELCLRYTSLIAGGTYNRYARVHPKNALDGDLHIFGCACKSLPHRDTITKIMHSEYELFCKGL